MARKNAQLIAAFLAALAIGTATARDRESELKTPRTPWHTLSREQQRALAPVAPDWDRMPGYQ